MQILDIITIILFSVGVLVTGISLSRSGKDLKGFFAGGAISLGESAACRCSWASFRLELLWFGEVLLILMELQP